MKPYLEHNRITVYNLEECIIFYKDLFGFEVRWEGFVPSGEKWVHLGTDSCYLSLSQAVLNTSKRVHPSSYDEFQGYTHMGWVVSNLESYSKKLSDLGVKDLVHKETDEGNHIYFFDPHGNEVELIEYKK